MVKIEKERYLDKSLNSIIELLLLNEKTIKDLKRNNTELKQEIRDLKARLDIWEHLEIA